MQYQIIDNKPVVVGIAVGAEVLQDIFDDFDDIWLGEEKYPVLNKCLSGDMQEFGLNNKIFFYEFLAPWFALSQKNNDLYSRSQNHEEMLKLLRKILVGNLLSMSKSLNYKVPGQIKCDVDLAETRIEHKNRNFVAFNGFFMSNFNIPDYLGIGKAVSMGFGTVRKITKEDMI